VLKFLLEERRAMVWERKVQRRRRWTTAWAEMEWKLIEILIGLALREREPMLTRSEKGWLLLLLLLLEEEVK